MRRAELIECFRDTQRISYGNSLKKKTEQAIYNQKVYYEHFQSNRKKNQENLAEIILEENTSFAAAWNYLKYGKTAVLNFANPVNPGGGVCGGAMAQEECLCRSSNLYAALSSETVWEEYYGYHRMFANDFYSDRLIYTPGITVFKTDDALPVRKSEDVWFDVDVITCAAPYAAEKKYINKTALYELFQSRIKNIFEAAIENEADVIILGAFGCGAFKNPPEVVAKAFYDTIVQNRYETYFNKIVFAVKRSIANDEAVCPNIAAFERIFGSSQMQNEFPIKIMTKECTKTGLM